MTADLPTDPSPATSLDRRTLLLGGSLAAAGLLAVPAARRYLQRPSPVFVAQGLKYDGSLTAVLRDALIAVGVKPEDIRGRQILLKPNLVEPTQAAPHVTTHPTVVLAAAEVLRGWGGNVRVGEAPGHVRDTELALQESGLEEALERGRLEFADLNYESTVWTPNRGRRSSLKGFHFPRSAVEADLLVSMPKMKTHHWMGVTAAMKNMYGVIPGIRYGWPKNVLHYNGIPQTVYDINASLPPAISIVDGIECMEGDGPIMGSPKTMGLLVVGRNAPAVDATVCRLMKVRPEKVPYLALAGGNLGPIREQWIEQRGEAWRPLAQPFEILDMPHLRQLRCAGAKVT